MGRWDGSKFAENKRRKEFLLIGLAGGAGVIALAALGVSQKTTGGSGGALTPPKIPYAFSAHVMKDTPMSYDGSNIVNPIPLILGTTAIKMDDEGTILTDPAHCGTPIAGSFLPDTLRVRTTRSQSGTLLELMPNGVAPVPVHENYQDKKVWSIETDAHYIHWVQSGLVVDYQIAVGEVVDANPFMQIFQSGINFGAGGVSSIDAYLKRIGVGTFETQTLQPQTDLTYSLGSATARWNVNYVSTISAVASQLVLTGGSKNIGWDGTKFFPGTGNDNSFDLGSSSLRWKNLFVPIINSGGSDLTLTPNTAVVPVSNNTKDLGSSSLRWAHLFVLILDSGASGLTINSGAGMTLNVNSGSSNLSFNGFGLNPSVDNNSNLGTTSLRWANIYTTILNAGANGMSIIGQNKTWTLGNNFVPPDDNIENLGDSSHRFANVYSEIFNSGNVDLTLTPNSAVVPNSDSAKDLGTSALRWRDLYMG